MNEFKSSPFVKLLILSPYLLYLYPAMGGFLGRSEVPIFMGRYAPLLLAWNLYTISFFIFTVIALKNKALWLRILPYFLLIINSSLVTNNNFIASLPSILIAMIVCRVSAGAVVVFLIIRNKETKTIFHNFLFSIAILIILFSLIDLSLLAITNTFKPDRKAMLYEYREKYDSSEITDKDIIIIGDSFVWGARVITENRFGNRLEQILSNDTHVYSFGRVGGAVKAYTKTLEKLPADIEAKRIILSYYMNDFPENKPFMNKISDALLLSRKSSPFLGLMGDAMKRKSPRRTEKYHEYVISTYAENDLTLSKRWKILEDQLSSFISIAEARSNEPVIFLIIPLMMNYADYPLEEVHRNLAKLAATLGYDPIDLLPTFKTKLKDGSKFTFKNDNHFNKETHNIVAHKIKQHINKQ